LRFLSGILLAMAWTYGCGGGSSTVTVTISPTTATVKLGQTEQFTAAVTGNSNTTVTWAVNNVTGGNASIGTVTTAGFYTAPTNAVNASSVSVTATSVADTSKSASATVTISSGAVVTVLPTTGATIAVGDCYQFSDTVTNLTSTTEPTAVNWAVNSVQGGNSTTGTITTTGYYCAPSQLGSSTTYVVKATLQADTTSYGQTNITVLPTGAPTLSTISPLTVAQGADFEDVYLEGSNFLSTSLVRVNATPVATTFISTSVLSARIPAASLAPSAAPGANGTLFLDVLLESGTTSNVVEVTTVPTATALVNTTPNGIPFSSVQTGSIALSLDGGFYTSGTTAEFNGQPATASVQNDRQLNLTASPSTTGITAGGLYSLNIRNPGATGQLSAANLAVGSGTSPSILTTYGVGSKPNSVAVNPVTGVALVANSGSNTISAFNLTAFFRNPQGNPQLPTTTVGKSPTGVAIDTVRNLAFVANNGDNTIQILDLSPLTASTPAPATVLSTISNSQTTPVSVYPYSIGVNSLTGQALVVYQGSNATSFINYAGSATPQNPTVTTDQIVSQIPPTGLYPQIAVEPKMNWALVTPGGNGTFAFLDLNGNGNENVASIAPPSSTGAVRSSGTTTITTVGSHGLSVGETVVIAGVNDPSFDGTFTVSSVPSTATFTYSQTGLPDTSTSSPTGNGTVSAAAPLVTLGVEQNTRGVAVNSETDFAVYTDPVSTSISILSLLDQSVSTINTNATGYVAAAINPLTNIAVAVNSNGTATLLDLQSQQILSQSQFTVGNNPSAVAIDPISNIALVVNQNDGTVTFIQLGSIRSNLPTPQPQVLDITPYSTLTGSSPLTLTVLGSAFTNNSVVRLNETPLVTAWNSAYPRQLAATVPASLLSSASRYVLDVLNADGTVSNVKEFTVMQAVNVGTSPHAVAIDRQRDLAVVANTGSNNVTLFKLSDMSILGTLNVGRSPTGVAVSSVFGRAAVTNNLDDTVSVIDLDNIAVSSTVSVAPATSSSSTITTSQPIGVAIHPGTGTTVVADSNSAQVSFFNIQTPGTATTLALDAGPSAVAIDPTRNIAAVAEAASNAVVIVDLGSSQVLDRETGFQLPTGAMYDPDSDTFLIVSSLANSFLSITARPQTGSYVTSAPYRVGINPTAIDYNYRSSTLVTANTYGQNLSIMDFQSKTVKAIIPLSVSQQFGVAIDPTRNRALVVDQANNRVLIVPLPR
jgi:DNA-binding beta-propeller fold protein YncE